MTTRTKKRPKGRQSRRRAQIATSPTDVHGWITNEQPFHGADEHRHLFRHADWAGPTKLIWHGESCLRVVQLFLPESLRQSEEILNAEIDQQLDDLIRPALAAEPSSTVAGWQPPGVHSLTGWLEDAGYPVTVDEQENLRLSLAGRGREGQLRLTREPGKLRLEMSLGSWQALDQIAEKAMYQLAIHANAQVQLARVAWLKREDNLTCNAQVDLSGIPVDGLGLLPTMLPVAVAAMQWTLSRLGLELEALASAKDSRIAEELLATVERGPRHC